MKIYIVSWGYYSCMEGGSEIAAIYSSRDLALAYIKNDLSTQHLKQETNKKTGEVVDSWTDGDYWISICIGYLDSPSLYFKDETAIDISNFTRAEVPGTGKTMDELRRGDQ